MNRNARKFGSEKFAAIVRLRVIAKFAAIVRLRAIAKFAAIALSLETFRRNVCTMIFGDGDDFWGWG
jgi:hypothetical protein